MDSQFLTIGILMLLSAMLPGPDFALVTKNTIQYSTRAGIYTAIGIGIACGFHITYCSLGLALAIANSTFLFNAIKIIGAGYLFYLGTGALLEKPKKIQDDGQTPHRSAHMKAVTALKQGILCNLLNPKATLFFLAIFTAIIKPHTPAYILLGIAAEMIVIIIAWFSLLALMLSHPRIMKTLKKAEFYISKILGIFLIFFGLALAFAHV